PITSLFPIPQPQGYGLRVFLSFGHLQMMLDAMPMLSLQVWRYFLPGGKAQAQTREARPELSPVILPAASRIYIAATRLLRMQRLGRVLRRWVSTAYEAVGESIAALVKRPAFTGPRPRTGAVLREVARTLGPVAVRVPAALLLWDPAVLAAEFTRT